VLWAIGTRCDPETSVTLIGNLQSTPLDPRLTPEKRARREYTRSAMIVDACKPYSWIKEFPPISAARPELRKQVLDKWTDLF
jgi:3-polyprenyl-4-hydroxybenzoate decarboxylase